MTRFALVLALLAGSVVLTGNPLAAAPSGPGPVVVPFGDAQAPGVPSALSLHEPAVGMAATADGAGYWLVASDGGVFGFGSARFMGSMGGTALQRSMVGMAAAPADAGYWLVAADGGVFAFGGAGFFGSAATVPLRRPIVGMASAGPSAGYWLAAADGGVFAYGGAGFFGSMGATALRSPVVGIAASPSGRGYWLVAADGGVFAFGDAAFFGSMGGVSLRAPVTAIAASPSGHGYWLVAADGGVFAFGDAGFFGSGVVGLAAGRQAVAIAASPSGNGYNVLSVTAALRIGFAGDVHGAGRVATLLGQGGDPLAGIRSVLDRNAFNVVNLETAVGTTGTPAQKEYTFQSPPALLTRLHDAGVSVVNLANNHSLDYGPGALLETIANAKAAGLLVVGAGATSAEAYAPAVVRLGAVSVAILGLSQVVPAGWGATASGPGVASAYNTAAVATAVRSARNLAQHVVVMIHAGVELSPCPSAEQRSLADTLVANGADVVVGAHPHVLQGIDVRATSLVAYSVGDFVWYAAGAETDKTGVLSVELGGGRTTYEFTPARIDATGSPQPLSGPAASSALGELQALTPGAGRC